MSFIAMVGNDATLSGLMVVDSSPDYSAVGSLRGNHDGYPFKICWQGSNIKLGGDHIERFMVGSPKSLVVVLF